MKVSELSNEQLDWAVVMAMGGGNLYWDDENLCFVDGFDVEFRPSVCWEHGGPIIEREGMHVDCLRQGEKPIWEAWPYATGTKHIQQGTTPLIAAMRCYVASKLGDEVEVPNKLQGE